MEGLIEQTTEEVEREPIQIKKEKMRIKKRRHQVFAIIIPISILFLFYIYLNLRSILELDYYNYLLLTVTYPELLWSYLIKITLCLLLGLPIGFFAKKKTAYIYCVIIILMTATARILSVVYSYSESTLSEKLYMIFDPFVLGIVIFLGMVIGKLFGIDYWQNKEIIVED